MIDFAVEKWGELGEEVPTSLIDRRTDIMTELNASRDKVLPLLEILENAEKVERLKNLKSVAEMCVVFELTPDVFSDGLVRYAKIQFDCGNYSLSADLLKHYRSLTAKDEGVQGMSS